MAGTVADSLNQLSEKEYKKRIRAWTLYDWANSAFFTTVVAAVLPVYYSGVAGATLPSAAKATQYWSLTISISVFIVAILSPILGTVSDIMRGKKKFLALFTMIGVIGTGLLMLVDTGDWLLASIFFIIGRIGVGSASVFYDALLPHVAKPEDQDTVSTRGYALGYLGGGLLLVVNIIMIFTMEGNWGVRYSFLTVAIWWAVFSIPILKDVPEPKGSHAGLKDGESLIKASFTQIVKTLRDIRNFDELFKFLIGFLVYNDGIGIIISIAVIYGAELGFGSIELILAIMLVQFVGIPYSLIFGNLPQQGNARQSMYVAFVVFNIVMLPLFAISSKSFLPNSITGTPSAPFVASATAVGEGDHFPADPATAGATDAGFGYEGDWQRTTFGADLTGLEESSIFAVSTDPGDQLNFSFNGQKVTVIYRSGPDHGVWAVNMDGSPLLDDAGEQVTIDAYNSNERFDDETDIVALDEGEHVMTLVNTGQKSAESSGNVMAISNITVKPPLRSSNLGAIIGMLVGLALVGLLFAWLTGERFFRKLADSLDTKRSIMLALVAYCIIAIWGFFLDSVVEFWFLAFMVATVQGGSQALSRSLYASMTPASMSGEFFGFFSIMSKFASFLSPFVFVASVAIFNSSRPGVLTLILFFLFGIYMLTRVDVEKGQQFARDRELEIAAGD